MLFSKVFDKNVRKPRRSSASETPVVQHYYHQQGAHLAKNINTPKVFQVIGSAGTTKSVHLTNKFVASFKVSTRSFATDDSGFHDDFKTIRKKYEQQEDSKPDDTKNFIEQTIKSNPVVIFMKGTPDAPRCGFSAIACRLLQDEGVTSLKAVDVLEDPNVREGIKQYTGWKTIPQIFINQEFVGGADIIKEMFQNGELTEKLKPVVQKK